MVRIRASGDVVGGEGRGGDERSASTMQREGVTIFFDLAAAFAIVSES